MSSLPKIQVHEVNGELRKAGYTPVDATKLGSIPNLINFLKGNSNVTLGKPVLASIKTVEAPAIAGKETS